MCAECEIHSLPSFVCQAFMVDHGRWNKEKSCLEGTVCSAVVWWSVMIEVHSNDSDMNKPSTFFFFF